MTHTSCSKCNCKEKCFKVIKVVPRKSSKKQISQNKPKYPKKVKNYRTVTCLNYIVGNCHYEKSCVFLHSVHKDGSPIGWQLQEILENGVEHYVFSTHNLFYDPKSKMYL